MSISNIKGSVYQYLLRILQMNKLKDIVSERTL